MVINMENQLWKRSLWINPDFHLISNADIIEYDMRDAGFSLIKKYRMLPEKTIEELDKLGKRVNPIDKKYYKHLKDERIGKLQRGDKALADKLKIAFEMERERFIKTNRLDESNIISIKKDAFFLFVKDKNINGKMDDFIEFRKKNVYTSYFHVDKLEIYYNHDKVTDIKGLGEETMKLHEKYMISFINKILYELESGDKNTVLFSLRRFIDQYKGKKLENGYYREMNAQSKFRFIDGETSNVNYTESLDEIDISFNYKIIIELLLNVLGG